MALHEADLEYESTPPDSEYEHTDIDPGIAAKFALWLTIAMVLSLGIVYGTFWLFEGRAQTASQASQLYPLAVGQVKEPTGPRLQQQPFKDLYQLKSAEHEKLTTYGWVDQGGGVVRIPIEDALRLLSERGAVPSTAQTADGLDKFIQDSSAGRTAAPRY